MRGLLAILLLAASVIVMGSDRRGCETETSQLKKQFSYKMNDGVHVSITMEHKPNGTMEGGKKTSISYYIVDCYLDKSRFETLTEEDLNTLLNRGLMIDLYDKTGNRLLRFDSYRRSYDAKIVKTVVNGVVLITNAWRLTWKGVLTESYLTFEAFRDVHSIKVKEGTP